jgi:uncharacterized protein
VTEIPLTEELGEFTPLQEFLRSARAPATTMSLSELDGFLTGVAVGPDLVMPSEWLPAIWGAEGPVSDNGEEMRAVLAVIMNRYNEILASLRQDPPEFAPILATSPTGEPLAWAEGFFHAVRMRRQAWLPLLKRTLLTPLLIVLPEADPDRVDGCVPPPEMVAEAIGFIPRVVAAIDDFWRSAGKEEVPADRGHHGGPPGTPAARAVPGANTSAVAGADQPRPGQRPQARKPSFLKPGLP